uniref:Uncharacterized protein n=1 Tax=Meloidogyne enterolobii TaxID=390850 RepID=A0A6V7VWA0_MELEN|nr:unnamed protein product [Meloidogyne enterolobii]
MRQKVQINKNHASNSVNLNGGERIRISINCQSYNKIKPIVETEEHTIQDTIVYSCSNEYSYDLIEYIKVIGLKKINGTDFIRIKRKLN